MEQATISRETTPGGVKVTWKRAARPARQQPVLSAAREADVEEMRAPVEDRSARVMVALATKAAKAPVRPPTASPLHKAAQAAGFRHAKSERVEDTAAHGYVHKDGRAILMSVAADGVETWMARWPGGAESGGSGLAGLAKALAVTAARRAAGEARAARRVEADRAKAAALADRALEAAKYSDVGHVVRPVGQTLPDGPPDHVMRAVRMLDSLTAHRFDLDLLKGDKHYSDRVALVNTLLNRGRGSLQTKVAETGITKVTETFYSAVGVGNGRSAAARWREFAERCAGLLKAWNAVAMAAAKAEKRALRLAGLRTAHERALPGKIVPYERPKGKKDRAEEADAARRDFLTLAATTEPIAAPRADVEVELVLGDMGLLAGNVDLWPPMMLQLERENSQGALCVYNNGSRVAAGVVPAGVLKRLRPIQGIDIAEAARQLLNPEKPGVPVTAVAARHLTAVIAHCKENTDMATKKKKFEAPAGAKAGPGGAGKKAARRAKGPAAERKSSLFRLNNATAKEWGAFTAQKGEIVAAFRKLGAVGAKAAGATRAALLAALPGVPAANVSFYLSKWQAPKIVEKLAAAE